MLKLQQDLLRRTVNFSVIFTMKLFFLTMEHLHVFCSPCKMRTWVLMISAPQGLEREAEVESSKVMSHAIPMMQSEDSILEVS